MHRVAGSRRRGKRAGLKVVTVTRVLVLKWSAGPWCWKRPEASWQSTGDPDGWEDGETKRELKEGKMRG